mmetsp:Transcript_26310/g.44398  ORF Transcript_26310/g.44398 Transcript_26310/m.44398 type:complete len:276 (-) Transcript_26310:2059-2886(-)
MEAEEALTRLLSLLVHSCHIFENSEATDNDTTEHRTDLEKTAELLHLSSSSFASITEGLDSLASLNTAAQEFNEKMTETIESYDQSYEQIKSRISELKAGSNYVSDLAEELSTSSMKIPSEEHLAKYEFMTNGFEVHLEKMNVFPYYQPKDDVLSKRLRQQDMEGGIVTSMDRCMTSRERDTVLSLEALDEVSRNIIDLRSQNDAKEESLNLKYNYAQIEHMLRSAAHDKNHQSSNKKDVSLTEKLKHEINLLETECLQLDDELLRIMKRSFDDC